MKHKIQAKSPFLSGSSKGIVKTGLVRRNSRKKNWLVSGNRMQLWKVHKSNQKVNTSENFRTLRDKVKVFQFLMKVGSTQVNFRTIKSTVRAFG